jgi:hypothetical protein
MISERFCVTLSSLVLSLCFSTGAWAGWIINQVIYNAPSGGSSNREVKSTSYFSKNRFKAVQGNSIIVINYDNNRVFIADRGRQIYWTGKIDGYINGIRNSVSRAKAKMQESLKNMTAEQRQGIENDMKNQGRSLNGEIEQPTRGVRIEKTSEEQIIAGYRATKYRILLDERAYQEVWISEDVSIFKDIDMKKTQDFQNRVNEALGSLYSGRSTGIERTLEYQRLFERGYPLKIVHVVGQDKGIIEVIGAKETYINDREFDIPDGYRTTTLEEIMKASRTGEDR